MNFNIQQQRGLSGTTWLSLLIIFGLFLTVFFKLFPLYMDDVAVANALDKLKEGQNVAQKVDNQIRQEFLSYLSDSNKKGLTAIFNDESLKESFLINRNPDKGTVNLKLTYERTKPFMFNIFFLVKFQHKIEAS
ncbi:hypothetical protein THII_2495 [Thioploca ingrica]|uniref:DUF4845 domain-containing protein n=1 Tax=Thioploca ingrica TaxID=40754 RepID=A0A090ALU2_9GAMM|nr:hypothetical protein THII_2495 [Thioploca ingrica]